MSLRGPIVALGVLLLGGAAFAAEPAKSPAPSPSPRMERAVFAAGCFWCVEAAFDPVPGVLLTTSGFTGGKTQNPNYEEVSAGGTGHAEAVQVTYDPSKVTYAQLLQVFWHNVDPLTPNAQFCDKGESYRSAIFVSGAEQRRLAEESKRALEASKRFDKPIVTQIVDAGAFYPAEEYHQDYYRKNPVRYRYYRYACGRDKRLKELWGNEAGGHG